VLRQHGPLAPASCSASVDGTTVELSPEQMGHAATIAGIAQRRGLPARAATIGIATAMQESKLVNVDYGDRDSLGLFQQRPSQGWGTPAQILDPNYAAGRFFDHLVQVPNWQTRPVTASSAQLPYLAAARYHLLTVPFPLLTADPGFQHLQILAEQHEIRPVALGQTAETVIEAQEFRRMERGHHQGFLQRQPQHMDAVADR